MRRTREPSRLAQALCAATGLFSAMVHAADYLDADNITEAVQMVSLERRVIEEKRKYCNEYFPDSKQETDTAALNWNLANEAELKAIESYLAQPGKAADVRNEKRALESAMALFRLSASEGKREELCGLFVLQLSAGERDVEQSLPQGSRILREYLDQHPLSPVDAMKHDFLLSCLRQGYQTAADFDQAQSYCDCTTSTVYARLSGDELARLARATRDHQSILAQPAIQRIATPLAQCKSAASGRKSPTQ